MRQTKQVIIMRKDLNMRKGKMVAQGAHASLGVFTRGLANESQDFTKQWLESDFRKICLSVDSLDELQDIFDKATLVNDMPVIMITDNGVTEFNGVSTVTCIAIGPYWSDEVDKLTGNLKLL